jgi:ribonuclease VapC
VIVDTSAIVAILNKEHERASFIAAIAGADRVAMSAGSWIELSAVISHRFPDMSVGEADRFRLAMRIEIAAVTPRQAQIGYKAYRDYGRRAAGPAKLNVGDCFAYALAIDTGEPLLFKGDDFIHTDVRRALP